MVDFVEICNVCDRKAIIEAAKRTINSDKVCRSYSDLNFGVTFFGTQCILFYTVFQKKTPTHIIGYKLRSSCLILIIFDTNILHII